MSVEDEVPNLRLNQTGFSSLPMLLAFADDLIVVARTVEDVEAVVAKIKEYLSYVGLELNEKKCQVLVRSPTGEAVEEVSILGQTYKTTEPMRYLGIYLTSKLERPMTTRTRCRNALKASRLVMGFLKRFKPTWRVARILYESVIAPMMIYGTQTAVLTKYSRNSIRGYEKQIILSMKKLCRADDASTLPNCVNLLLQKRRITKKIRIYQMRWWGHVQRREPSHPLRVAARLRARHLRSCRPSYTWWDMILQTMQRYGDLTHEEWKLLALNKEQFHKKLLELFEKEESDDSDWGKTANNFYKT